MVREAVKLKKEPFRDVALMGAPEIKGIVRSESQLQRQT